MVGRDSSRGIFQHIFHWEKTAPELDTPYLRDLLAMQEQIINLLNCGVISYTMPDMRVLAVNDTMRKLYGFPQDMATEEFEQAYRQLIDPEDLQTAEGLLAGLRASGDSADYQCRIRRKDGTRLQLKCNTARRTFAGGQDFLLSVVQDITGQEQLRASLKREKKLYRYALTNGVDCCFSFDVTTGMITDPVRIHGLDIPGTLGLSLPMHYDEFSARFLERYNIQFSDPSMRVCYSCQGLRELFDREVTSVEAECLMPYTGIYYDALVVMSRDSKDGHIYALYFSRDTTEQHVREEARRRELEDMREELSASNQVLQQALDSEQRKTRVIGAISNMYIAIFHVNLTTGAYLEVNGSHFLEEMYRDFPRATEAFSHLIGAKVAPSFRERTLQFIDLSTLQERMGDEKAISLEYQTDADVWVRSSIIEAKRDEDGRLTEVLFATERIDEEKRRELMQQEALKEAFTAANRANEAKTTFLASMSHDIRTPMNVIIGMTAIAGTHLDDRERVADCLSKITTSSRHLLGLINEVLDMNRIESGKLELNMEEFNLSDLLDNLLTMVRPQIRAKGHELVVNIRNVEHEQVIGDSRRIQQVFVNLMGNAVKYTPEGGRIELTIRENPSRNARAGCYEFTFQDNGIGMSQDFLPHIFEAFTRAKDNMVEKMQGSGLGLAITNNIVRMMNGDIRVESKLGEGSRFTVTIFLELQEVDEATGLERLAELPVLVVDDDRDSCESACELLCGLGMAGEWVLSGQEAVERVENGTGERTISSRSSSIGKCPAWTASPQRGRSAGGWAMRSLSSSSPAMIGLKSRRRPARRARTPF